jgi:hypothetical protein
MLSRISHSLRDVRIGHLMWSGRHSRSGTFIWAACDAILPQFAHFRIALGRVVSGFQELNDTKSPTNQASALPIAQSAKGLHNFLSQACG